MNEDVAFEFEFEAEVDKPSRADRMERNMAARKRRYEVKHEIELHAVKEEHDDRQRYRAKNLLAKQKRQKMKKTA